MRTVAHSVNRYLFLTGHWLYDLISHIQRFKQVILAEEKLNIDCFPFDPVYAWSDFSRIRQQFERFKQKLFSLPDRPFRLKLAKQHKVLLIHSHFGNRGFWDIGLVNALGVKHVTSFYGYDATREPTINREWKEKYRRLFDSCHVVLAEGPHMLQTILNLGCPPEKARVLRIGVDTERIPYRKRRINEDGLVRLLIAGSFVEKKGIPYAIKAIGLAYEHYKNIRVTIVGDATPVRRDSLKEKEKIMRR